MGYRKLKHANGGNIIAVGTWAGSLVYLLTCCSAFSSSLLGREWPSVQSMQLENHDGAIIGGEQSSEGVLFS